MKASFIAKALQTAPIVVNPKGDRTCPDSFSFKLAFQTEALYKLSLNELEEATARAPKHCNQDLVASLNNEKTRQRYKKCLSKNKRFYWLY